MTIRVLIADDHRVMRQELSRYPDLEIVGAAVERQDVSHRVQYLHLGVVLLDAQLPGMDGIASSQRLRTKSPEVRIVVLTMGTDPEHIRRSYDANIAGCVVKAGADERRGTSGSRGGAG
jgi:DNA-binding NarL/FixJ family response regulator